MMNELVNWISKVPGLSVKPRTAARAFWVIDIKTEKDLVAYLAGDRDYYANRPKGIGEENYKLLVDYAVDYVAKNTATFVGLTCSNGVSFTGYITKQDYAEFIGVIEALQIWFDTRKCN